MTRVCRHASNLFAAVFVVLVALSALAYTLPALAAPVVPIYCANCNSGNLGGNCIRAVAVCAERFFVGSAVRTAFVPNTVRTADPTHASGIRLSSPTSTTCPKAGGSVMCPFCFCHDVVYDGVTYYTCYNYA